MKCCSVLSVTVARIFTIEPTIITGYSVISALKRPPPSLCVISAAVIPCFSVARVVTNIGHNKETSLHPAAAHGLASLLTHHSMKIAVLEKSVRDNGVTPCRACVVKLGTV